MRRTDNGTEPTAARAGRPPEDGLLPELSLYERLIGNGTAAADARDRPVDHVTARRLAIWLAARPQAPGLRPGPGPLRPDRSDQPGAEDPAAHPRPLGKLPRPLPGRPAHALLRRPRHRPRPDRRELRRRLRPDRPRRPHAARPPRPGQATAAAPPGKPGRRPTAPGIVALAGRDPDSQTVTLILDATTASIAIFAIAAHADEREAHLREVERFGQTLPEGSYGRRNRQAIAARETRIAARLRAVEHAYRMAIERDAVFRQLVRQPHFTS